MVVISSSLSSIFDLRELSETTVSHSANGTRPRRWKRQLSQWNSRFEADARLRGRRLHGLGDQTRSRCILAAPTERGSPAPRKSVLGSTALNGLRREES